MNFDRIINDNDCQWENIDLKNYVIADHAAPGARNQLFNEMNKKDNSELSRIFMSLCCFDSYENSIKFRNLIDDVVKNNIGRQLLVNISYIMSHRIKLLNELVEYLFIHMKASSDAGDFNKFIGYIVYLYNNMSDVDNCRAKYLKSMYKFVVNFMSNCKSGYSTGSVTECHEKCFAESFLSLLLTGFFDNFCDLDKIIKMSSLSGYKTNHTYNISLICDIVCRCSKLHKIQLNNKSNSCLFAMNPDGCLYSIDIDIDNFDNSREIATIYAIDSVSNKNKKIYMRKQSISLKSALVHELCHLLQYLEYNVMGFVNSYAQKIYKEGAYVHCGNEQSQIVKNDHQSCNTEEINVTYHTDNLEAGVIYGGTVNQDNALVFDDINSKNFDIHQSLFVDCKDRVEYLRYFHVVPCDSDVNVLCENEDNVINAN